MKPYIIRMIEELEDLQDKVTKGEAALKENKFPLTEEEHDLLFEQMEYYKIVINILERRIEIAKTKEGEI